MSPMLVRSRRFVLSLSILGLMALLFILLSGGASATPDSNNDFGTSVPLSNHVPITDSLSDVDDMSDYYRVLVSSGDVLEVYLGMPVGTDFDLYLYDSSFNLITSSQGDNIATSTYSESITITLFSPGYYFLEVAVYSGSGPYTIRASTTAEWTVMVYLDADNNLENAGITDFMEMSNVGSRDELNILVQFDRIPGYDNAYGDWTSTNRYHVSQGMTPTAANAVSALGEVNMGDPTALASFINWGVDNYPANRYMLVLWDHGGNWQGVCWDDTSDDNLALVELRIAMDIVRSNHSGFSFDVIGFDACVMSGVEVLNEVCGYTDFIVASQLNEPGPGWNYQVGLGVLAGAPTMNAYSFSLYMADAYVESYSVPYAGYYLADVNMAVIDASKVQAMVTALDQLASEMLSRMAYDHNYYQTAWDDSAKAYYDYPDLQDLLSNLMENAPTDPLRQKASSALNATLDTLEFYGFHEVSGGQVAADMNGIGIYFAEPGYFDNYYRTSALLFTSTSWDEMLLSYYSAVLQANDPVAIASKSPTTDATVAAGSSQEFSVTVDDADPDTMVYNWTWDGADLPVNSSGIIIYPEADDIGTHTLGVQVWDGASFASAAWTVTVVEGPDLSMTGFYLYEDDSVVLQNATSGRPFNINIEAYNTGDVLSGKFNVTLYVDGIEAANWYWVDAPVLHGHSWLCALGLVISEPGEHLFTFVLATVDPSMDGNASNNVAEYTVNVVPAEWTILVYLDGDNNLEKFWVDSFLQMAGVGSNADVSVVVQFDRISDAGMHTAGISSGYYDSRYGDWAGAKRFYVTAGITPTAANATQDLGEVNMAHRDTLKDFLLWGVQSYSAERYMVVLKDHGAGWYGCCYDTTSGNDRLSNTETSYALRAMVNETGSPVDLLLFDDCLMGSFEVAVEMYGLAIYMVASETVGWTDNFDYGLIVAGLQGNLGAGTADIAVAFVEQANLVDSFDHTTQCLAAYDLGKADQLVTAMNAYVDRLRVLWSSDSSGMVDARLGGDHLDLLTEQDTLDLHQFIGRTWWTYQDDELNAAAEVLWDLLEPSSSSMVLASRSTPCADFCQGMSIYFPRDVGDFYHDQYFAIGASVSAVGWADLLVDYYSGSAPATFIDLQGNYGSLGWYISNVTVSFTVYDPAGLGAAYLNYSLDGVWHPYTGAITLTDGLYDIEYYSVGYNGKVEAVQSWSLSVDTAAPTVQVLVDDLRFMLNATDSMSGMHLLSYRVDGGPWNDYTGPVDLMEGNTYLVEYMAEDEAGNVRLGNFTVGDEDSIAPVSSIAVSGTAGDAGWYTGTVTVTLSATDSGGSGLEGIYYRVNGGNWTKYTVPVTLSSDGTYAIEYQARDNFGNVEEVRTRTVLLDATKPLADAALPSADGGWHNSAVRINLTAEDAGSGVYVIQYRLDGGAWVNGTAVDISDDGTHVLEYFATDVAGNSGDVMNVTVRMDATAPQLSLLLFGFDPELWGNGSAAFELDAADDLSGVAAAFYRVDGGEWLDCVGAIFLNETGTFLLEFYAVDNANNSAPVINATLSVDVSAPECSTDVGGLEYQGSFLNSADVSVTMTDEGVGQGTIFYRLGNDGWIEWNGSLTLGVGTFSLSFYAVDVLGNEEDVRTMNITVVAATVPGPSILAAEVIDGTIHLIWAAQDNAVLPTTSFKVYRSVNGGEAILIATVTGTSYSDRDVEAGAEYAYHVVAVNMLGDGAASAAVVAEVPEDAGLDLFMVGIVAAVLISIAVVAMVLIRRM